MRIVLDAFGAIVRALRVSARAAEKRLGISGAQLFVLSHLAERDGQSIGDLAESTFTDQSSVSVVVTRLASRGLVMRRSSAQDARRTEVTLTRAGRAVLRRAPAAVQARLINGLQRLRPAQRRVLARELTSLVRAIGIEEPLRQAFFEDEPPRRARQRRGLRR